MSKKRENLEKLLTKYMAMDEWYFDQGRPLPVKERAQYRRVVTALFRLAMQEKRNVRLDQVIKKFK